MKIVVLNEFFFSVEYLSKLKSLGEVEVFLNTDSEELAIERLKDAEIALGDCFIAPLNKKVLESTNKLKLLILNSTGYDRVDLEAASQKGIKVANAPGFSTDAVAELAIGLMFAINRKIVLGDKAMRENPFEADPGNRDHDKFWGFNLKGKTLGVIGLGRIGLRMAELGLGLGMKVVAYNRSPRQMGGVKLVSLKELLQTSDVVSIHLALNSETKNIISKEELKLMKQASIIINTGGYKHIVTDDLLEALIAGRISGAALDIVDGINKNHPILKLDNVVLTPHIGSSTYESWKENIPEIAISEAEAFINGKPINIVN